MIFKLMSGTLLVVLAAWAFGSTPQDPEIKIDLTKFMERKLDSSREIVAGLAIADYEKISKSAQDMMLLSHESAWNVIQSEAYIKMSQEFRIAAERLRDTAHQKNLDGATIAYFEVTLNCVRCHRHIRQLQGLED